MRILLMASALALLVSTANAATIGYYRFEEASGLPVNSEGPGNDANHMFGSFRTGDVPVNPVPQNGFANTQSLTPGGGSGGRGVRVGDPSDVFFFGDSDFTIEGWVQLSSLSSGSSRQYYLQNKPLAADGRFMDYSVLVQGGDTQGFVDDNYGKLSGLTGREIVLVLGKGNSGTDGTWAITSNFEITDSAWHHFSVAYDTGNDQVRFTLDDQAEWLAFDQRPRGGSSTNGGPLLLGSHTNASGTYNQWVEGQMDEVRISSGVVPLGDLLNVPEPASLALLVFGGLFVRRR